MEGNCCEENLGWEHNRQQSEQPERALPRQPNHSPTVIL